jgi:N-acetylneuraminic acid mutarotase
MTILHSIGAGLLSATPILARRVAFPVLFLGAGLVLVQPCARASSVFTNTGSLATARYQHTETLLPSGGVLVVAGSGVAFNDYLASAELYGPASGTWTATGSLATARFIHTATLLTNGKVLVAGGRNSSGPLASAELYDPASGTWTVTGSLTTARQYHTATLLTNGKVLVAGGQNISGYLASAELYDPASGTWTTTGSLAAARAFHTATLLTNGKVLAAGGLSTSGASVATAELYDPASGTWTTTGTLATARRNHTATLLTNGKVLVAGGLDTSNFSSASAELYDPASGTWTTTGSLLAAAPRYNHTATLLTNGKVLAAGGLSTSSGTLASAELYDPGSGTWTVTGSLGTARSVHTAALLLNGNVLVAGGSNDSIAALASAELYAGPMPIPTPTPTPTPRPATLGNISTRLQVGTADRVMIAGFIVQGNSPKKVLIRAAGPSLTQFGVPNALANPQLELHDTNNTIGMNDNWQTTQLGGVITSDQVAEIQNSGLAPRDPAESALIATLPPGTYTAIVQGVSGGTGVGIVEAYDLNAASGSILANISTRGFVQTGDNVMIGGFIVVTQPTRVIIRAIGPSLTQFGVPDALTNPQLELHDTNNTIARNDDWQTTQIFGIITSDQVAAIQNSQLAPTNPLESAIIATLQPGNYTAIVRGFNSTLGNALVEVYALP